MVKFNLWPEHFQGKIKLHFSIQNNIAPATLLEFLEAVGVGGRLFRIALFL
jgi:hypothetical protein